MSQPRTYPAGVPCWIDTEQPDPDAAGRFYGELFGWTSRGGIAALDGQPVAGIVSGSSAIWNTYISVDDAAAVARSVAAAGGSVVAQPVEVNGGAGRAASCVDPEGATFRLWQPRDRPGAQVVNSPGAWNFSHLRTDQPDQARAFYAAVFGWEAMNVGGGALMWRRPGYGDHLEATVDPDIRARQAHAPPGFEDAIAGLVSLTEGGAPHWYVVFTVADRDDAVAVAQRLGADVISSEETMWTREAAIRDPQGAELTLSQFAPPDDWG